MFEQCESGFCFIRTDPRWKTIQISFEKFKDSPILYSRFLSLSLSLYILLYGVLNCLTDRPIWSSDVSLWKSGCWLQWEGGICMISWPLTLRLCVEGNLGFLRPVRISQAFLSAQESGSAADTSLSFTLHVSLFVCLLNPSGQVL